MPATLAFPLRFRNGQFVTIEQGSQEDRRQRVETLFRFEQDFRDDLPEFGLPDQAFVGPDLDEIEQVVNRWEPDLAVAFGRTDYLDIFTSAVRTEVS